MNVLKARPPLVTTGQARPDSPRWSQQRNGCRCLQPAGSALSLAKAFLEYPLTWPSDQADTGTKERAGRFPRTQRCRAGTADTAEGWGRRAAAGDAATHDALGRPCAPSPRRRTPFRRNRRLSSGQSRRRQNRGLPPSRIRCTRGQRPPPGAPAAGLPVPWKGPLPSWPWNRLPRSKTTGCSREGSGDGGSRRVLSASARPPGAGSS